MGTYTTNYNLFMPSVGEQGWGELVNGNFTTIDTTLKGLDTHMGTAETNITSLTTRMGTAETTIASNKSRLGTLETDTDAFDGRIKVLETTVSNHENALNGTHKYTVTATSIQWRNLYVGFILPYVYDGTYTGIINVYDTSNSSTIYFIKSNGSNSTVSTNSIGNITIPADTVAIFAMGIHTSSPVKINLPRVVRS